MRVDELGVEPPLRHQGRRAMGGAAAFAADAEHRNVIAHQLGDIDRHRLVGEADQANPSAAHHHVHAVVQAVGLSGAFDDIVNALAAGDALHRLDRIFRI